MKSKHSGNSGLKKATVSYEINVSILSKSLMHINIHYPLAMPYKQWLDLNPIIPLNWLLSWHFTRFLESVQLDVHAFI